MDTYTIVPILILAMINILIKAHKMEYQFVLTTDGRHVPQETIYLAEKYKKLETENFNTIVNLREHVSTFKESHCLVVLDNLRSTNIDNLEVPTIIRKIQLSFLHISTTFYYDNGGIDKLNTTPLIYSPVDLTSGNHTGLEMPCFRSSYLLGLFWSGYESYKYDFCLRLNIVTFSAASKTWNCQVHFSLFPPHFDKWPTPHEIYKFPELPLITSFSNGMEWELSALLPSIVPAFHIIFTELDSPVNLENIIRSKSDVINFHRHNQEMQSHQPQVSHDLLFVANVLMLTSTGNILFEDKRYKILNIQLLCLHCLLAKCPDRELTKSTYQYCTKVMQPNVSQEMIRSHIETTNQLKFNDETFWKIEDFQNTQNLAVALLELKLCLPPIRYSSESSLTLPRRSAREKLAYVRMHILTRFIWKNYSYLANEFEICQNGQLVPQGHVTAYNGRHPLKIKHKPYVGKATGAFPQSFINFPNSLRFIACGSIGKNQYPFEEFINVFKPNVWLLIVLTSIVTVYLFSVLAHRSRVSCNRLLVYTECVIRTLLNQDGECPKRVEQQASGKIVLVGLGLAVTVLSNAYKNDNCYRMIVPRTHKPIRYFEAQLLPNKFSVYGQLDKFKNTDYTTENITGLMFDWAQWAHNLLGAISNEDEITFVSEISSYMIGMGGNADTNLSKCVFRNSKVHPALPAIVGNFTSNPDNLRKTGTMKNLVQWILQTSSKHLMNVLRECKNTAVVVSFNDLPAIANDLNDYSNISEYIHVGAELYYLTHTVTVFTGSIPPNVLRRIKGLNETGVWNWWLRYINESSQFIPNNRVSLKAPDMTGNVLVIFLVYLGGLTVGLVFFLTETLVCYVVKAFIVCMGGVCLLYAGKLRKRKLNWRKMVNAWE